MKCGTENGWSRYGNVKAVDSQSRNGAGRTGSMFTHTTGDLESFGKNCFTVSEKSRKNLLQMKEDNCNIIGFLKDGQMIKYGAELECSTADLYRVPESVTYIAPYAICDEGGWLSGIFVQSGVSDENIDELVLREGFYIAKNEPSGPPISGSSFPDDAKRYTELFNTNADEWELLRKNVGNCGKYANEYGDILEWLHNNDGDNLEGYTFSIVSDEYQDPHFYCYKEGLPKLMIALDFWRWVKKMGPGDSEPRVPEYTMLDDTVHYDI